MNLLLHKYTLTLIATIPSSEIKTSSFSIGDFLIISLFVVGIIGVGLYFLNKWAVTKNTEQQQFIETNKQIIPAYIIDKSHDKICNVQMPKLVLEQIPKHYKYLKMYFVKAKIGPQIMTLMCSKEVYKAVTIKKNIKLEVAGIYIVSVVGMKSKAQLKEAKKKKKQLAKKNK